MQDQPFAFRRWFVAVSIRVAESEVYGWSRILNNTGSWSRIFSSDFDSGCPIGSFLTSHSKTGNSCWNGTISCCVPRFPLILTAKFHSLYVEESEVGNFVKVGVGSRKLWKVEVGSRIFYLRLRSPGLNFLNRAFSSKLVGLQLCAIKLEWQLAH